MTTRSTELESTSMQGHPRGRGFSILSRLAREREVPEATTAAPQPARPVAPEPTPEPAVEPVSQSVAPEAPVETFEWMAPVVPLERPEPKPRHRRDVAFVSEESDDFVVSAVSVARRSS